ncbi:hypothetical protein CVT24_012690 [Panaeolus cyanescens]|uniref:G domain-containing protein n=1 Tax=Panaeolus cyanescens TaxID=181874 RepID=A0A409YK44_9AGAR|nr:hypothetical protein CVT24_012690 [Panaeolus cyanescens]
MFKRLPRRQSTSSSLALTAATPTSVVPSLAPLPFQRSNPQVIQLQDVDLLSDLVILVMGATGGGKSTIINILAGGSCETPIIPINSTLEPCTDFTVVRVSSSQGTLCFIEVPEMKDAPFSQLYQRYNVIGIIFIHKVIDSRVSGELLRDMEEIKRCCNEDPLLASHIVCITTHWTSDQYDDDQELCIESQLMGSDELWGRQHREEGLVFKRFALEKPREVVDVLDHLLERERLPGKVISKECKEDEVWASRDWKIVVAMGMTGAGKSNFIEKAGGIVRIDPNAHLLESRTQSIQAYKVHINGHKLILVDTPGFNDTHRSDYEILKTIATWLESTFRHQALVSGVLYFHRITDNRMSGTAVSNINVFQGLIGKGLVYRNIKIVTTMWDHDLKGVGDTRENELREEYWGQMTKGGASVVRFHNTHESAKEILKSFRTDWHIQQALQLQVEMVKHHHQLKETKAGQLMYSKLEQLLSEHNELLNRLRKEGNNRYTAHPDYVRLMESLKEVQRDMAVLQLGFGSKLKVFFTKR